MKVLLFCDEHYHPGATVIGGVEPLKSKGYNFDVIKNGRDFKPEMLKDYRVVLMSKCDEISPDDREGSWKTDEVQQAFIDFVDKGGGMLVIHSGTVPGKNTDKIDKMVGSKFSYHPNNAPVTVAPVKPHPINEGVEQFCELDEHYYLDFLADDVDVILASYAPAQGEVAKYKDDPYHNYPEKVCASGYVRKQNNGRVCVLTPGHHLAVWLNPQFQKILDNALKWCAG